VSLAVYDVIVPKMLHGLYVLNNFLDHAQTLERSKWMDPGTVPGARLAPDMLTFGEQFSVGCNKVEAHVVKLLGRACPAPRAAAMTYPALKGRLVETRGFLQALRPEEFDDAQSRTYDLTPVVARGWFGGDDYIRHLVLPDFFFRMAIAHAILRHLGARVGKRDYIGSLST
jgi:hypothetical protein